MIIALCQGRGGSKGFPGKNKYLINGHPMMSYPIRAAVACKEIDEVFFSTDSLELTIIASAYGAKVIDRPAELATDEALAEDVFVHAYEWVLHETLMGAAKNLGGSFKNIVFSPQPILVVLLFANAVGITSDMIRRMIEEIRGNEKADGICTVSEYPAFSPYRMRKINSDGCLVPFDDNITWAGVTCDRSSGEKAYIYDCCCAVVKPKCLENIEDGMPPQRWLGGYILPFIQETPCLDVDSREQLGQIEFWLRKHWEGFDSKGGWER